MTDNISYLNYVKQSDRHKTIVTLELFEHPISTSDGKFSISDIRKAYLSASNNQDRGTRFKAVDKWLANSNTQDLLDYLNEEYSEFGYSSSEDIICTVEGRNGGTYVCRELAYSFAMWCDPIFSAYVVHSFRNLVDHKFTAAYIAANKVTRSFMKLEWVARAARLESKGMPAEEYFAVLLSDIFFRVTGKELEEPISLRNYIYDHIGENIILERILNSLELLWDYEDADEACEKVLDHHSSEPGFDKLIKILEDYCESNDITWS